MFYNCKMLLIVLVTKVCVYVVSFLSIGHLHCIARGDLEAMQVFLSLPSLSFILKLHKGYVTTTRYQPHLPVARKPVECGDIVHTSCDHNWDGNILTANKVVTFKSA